MDTAFLSSRTLESLKYILFLFVGDLLSASSSATSVITSLVSSSFTSIKEMVSTEVSRVSEKILEQETLSIECKAELQRLLVSKCRCS